MNSSMPRIPTFAELAGRTDAPAGSSWGVFGAGNDLGTLNFLSEEVVRNASANVRRGALIGLDFALERMPVPPSHQRNGIQHTVFGNGTCHRDDWVHLYLQAATHFDGMRHMRHPVHGLYNGASNDDAIAGRRLGFGPWIEKGIAGRGVLVDLPRARAAMGRSPLAMDDNEPITVEEIQMTLAHQNVVRQPGDILMLRTGWLDWYFAKLTDADRAAIPGRLRSPGLAQDPAVLEWLWDTQVAAVVADNPGVECVPAMDNSTFARDLPDGSGLLPGGMHADMIALLGLCIGELWDFNELAADCAHDGIYESFFVAKPLYLNAAVGSPANAYAIK